MTSAKRNKVFPCTLLLMFFPIASLFPQEAEARQVALIPFWGANQEIITGFGDELFIGLGALDGFQPVAIDMNDLPPGVPVGGFPPFVSPGPALTRGMPFAITGDTNYNADTSQWHLRLFLWDMSDSRLLFSDEMAVPNRQILGMVMPGMLDWLFSWIPAPEPEAQAAPQITLEGRQLIIVRGTGNIHNWLYIGLRTGGNLHLGNPFSNPYNLHWKDFRVAASFHFQFLRLGYGFLGIQPEIMYVLGESRSWMLHFLPRITTRSGTSSFSLLVGPSFILPLGNDNGHPLGFTAGFNLGNRVGPGYVFTEIRWSGAIYDPPDDLSFKQHALSVSLGFKIGVFRR